MADKMPPPPPMPGPLPSSFGSEDEFFNERPLQKAIRKIKEEPLVPLGIGLTVFAFINAHRALRRGDSRQANKMFRARVAAQGFTVVAMVAGSMYYSQDRQKTKELRKLKEERDAEEKRQKWIRELEARDEEEKYMKATLKKRREQIEAAAAPPPVSADSAEQETGGILGKMGLWSKGQEKEAEVPEKKVKKENPKSSLGAIGEVMTSKKKDDDDSRK